MQPGLALQSTRSMATCTWSPSHGREYGGPRHSHVNCRRRELKNGTHGERIGTWCGLPVCTL